MDTSSNMDSKSVGSTAGSLTPSEVESLSLRSWMLWGRLGRHDYLNRVQRTSPKLSSECFHLVGDNVDLQHLHPQQQVSWRVQLKLSGHQQYEDRHLSPIFTVQLVPGLGPVTGKGWILPLFHFSIFKK